MNPKQNKLVKEEVPASASVRGGPMGFGGKKQLAAPLNPATQAMENQEQDEFNRNIQNLDHVNSVRVDNKNKAGYIGERDEVEDSSQMSNLPGNVKDNTIEAPEMHTPQERARDTDDYLIDDMVNQFLIEFSYGASGGVNRSSILPDLDDDVDAIEPADISPGLGVGMLVAPADHIPEEAPQESEMENVYEMYEESARHNQRYGAKPPSSSQVLKKFKIAKAMLLDLTQTMVLSGNTDDMGEINHMVGTLQRIEKRLMLTEEQKVREDVGVDVETHIVDKIMERLTKEINKNGK